MFSSAHSVHSTGYTPAQVPQDSNNREQFVSSSSSQDSQISKRPVSPVYSTVKGKDKFLTEEEYNRLRTGVNALLRHEENQKEISLHPDPYTQV